MALEREKRGIPLIERAVEVPAEGAILRGVLAVPSEARGIVFLANSEPDAEKTIVRSGQLVRALLKAGFGTLMIGLITEKETSGRPMVGTGPLNDRMVLATAWLAQQPKIGHLPIGYYASEIAAPAAVQASIESRQVRAIVSNGGRLDLAFNSLHEVKAATLLLAEQENGEAIAMGQTAYNMLRCTRKFVIVQGQADQASDMLEVPEEVVLLAQEWFQQHLPDSEG
jgi:putative phosphoribosyl transferase